MKNYIYSSIVIFSTVFSVFAGTFKKGDKVMLSSIDPSKGSVIQRYGCKSSIGEIGKVSSTSYGGEFHSVYVKFPSCGFRFYELSDNWESEEKWLADYREEPEAGEKIDPRRNEDHRDFFIQSLGSDSEPTRYCHKVNGNGIQKLVIKHEKNKNILSIVVPESKLGLGLTLTKTVDYSDLYDAKLFANDGAVTYSAIVGTDTDSDYILYTTSGDIDTQTSFYRCAKSGHILD